MNAVGVASSRAVKPRKQAERRKEAERRMLDTAVRLVAEKGFAGLTLNEVGEEAGYSRGLPAHYFGTKDALIGAIAKHIVGGFGRLVRREDKTPGLDAILWGVDLYLKTAAKEPVAMRTLLVVLTEATSNPNLFPDVAEVNRHAVDVFARDIRAGQRAGEIHPDVHPKSQAILILGQLRGVVAQWLVEPEVINIDRVRTEFIASLKRSLAI